MNSTTARKVLHLDLDAFFCAVEEIKDPSLRHKIFAVGGQPDKRGVVSTCSYAARMKGIHSAMPMAQAIKLAPELLILPGDFAAYRRASEQVMEIVHDLTPLVEQVSVDEAFLEVTDLPQDPAEIAATLQTRIYKNTQLPCSLGVATNKLVAKIANDFGKARKRGLDYPNAITVVKPGEEAAFLAPLPVGAMWGIGKKSAAYLNSIGFTTLGQLAEADLAFLQRYLGNQAHIMQRHARGISESPLQMDQGLKSISNETTFEKDVADLDSLLQVVLSLTDKVAYRLRKHQFSARTVRIKLRWSDFSTITRQEALPEATNLNSVIYKVACGLVKKEWKRGKKVRLIGVGTSNLQAASTQLNLFDSQEQAKETRLLDALDDLRHKYGGQIIQRGSRIRFITDDKEE